jgi:two-component system CheB/CheR fusion protein
MPEKPGMAFIIVQHLDPDRKSLMADLLGRHTAMPVVEVAGERPIDVDRVYLAPPDRYLTVDHGVLKPVRPTKGRRLSLPIDVLLRSLAEDQRERSIGVILSGSGSDGANGLKAIKEAGGLVVVEAPEVAGCDGMPRTAIATGIADLVLPPEDLPSALTRYATQPYVRLPVEEPAAAADSGDRYLAVLALLKTRLKRDFHYYRRTTLRRRIQRRMGINHLAEIGEYLELIKANPEELQRLAKDLLISVTQFFRDPAAYDLLARLVIPELLHKRDRGDMLRLWVPGCATGEEAYSLAIVLLEAMAREGEHPGLQIFATDIDPDSIRIGRVGHYPDGIVADLSPERLHRFFTRQDDGYRVNKQIRDCLTFAEQNLISDPPFSRLDLISCRNLLIYVEPSVQRQLLSLFHYALNDGGYLFLGSSETVGRRSDLFEKLDKTARLYRRRDASPRQPTELPVLGAKQTKPSEESAVQAAPPRQINFAEITHRVLSRVFGSAAVLVDSKGEPLYFVGPTDRYLRLPAGHASQTLVAMARSGLKTKLRAALAQAGRTGRDVVVSDVLIKSGGERFRTRLTVLQLREPEAAEGFLLVTFDDEAKPISPPPSADAEPVEESLVQQLERELLATREALNTATEELEANNEEAKASNEESMSMNEELQSANEELETSKEEAQSLNEELTTMNAQLQDKVAELETSNNDMINFVSSTEIATIFLDADLRIKRFTPAITKLINVIPSDVGRPLVDFSTNVVDSGLVKDAREVLDRLMPLEQIVRSRDGSSFLRRVLPYRTDDDHIEGVVVTYGDVSKLLAAEADMRRLATVVRDSADAITVQDRNGRILAWNRGAAKLFGYSEEEALGMNIEAIVPEDLRGETRNYLGPLFNDAAIEPFETRRRAKDGRLIDVWLTATALKDAQGDIEAVAVTQRDITERNSIRRQLEESRNELQRRVERRTADFEQAKMEAELANRAKSDFLASMSHDLRTPLNSIIGFAEATHHEIFGPQTNAGYAEYMDYILESSRHLLQLINDILDISKIEAGKEELYEEAIDFGATIKACLQLVRLSAEKGQVVLREDIPAGLPWLYADERRVKQTLFNLLSNAVKFSGAGGEVRVDAGVEQDGGMAVTIRDSGIGMSAEEVEQALEPFGQTNVLVTRETAGTGLGLPLARRLTELHGGTLEIASEKGAGTNVTVRYPASRVRAAENT